MITMGKKAVSMILSFILVASLMPASSLAAGEIGDENVRNTAVSAAFIDGDSTYGFYDVKADTYTLTAPGEKYYFAGWFSGLSADGEKIVLEDGRYVLKSGGVSDETEFIFSEFRPKYEDEPESDAYHALWICENDTLPTVMALEVYPESIIYRKVSYSDPDEQIISNNEVLRIAWRNVDGGNHGRVKLLKDMIVDDFAYKGRGGNNDGYFSAGLWLDLNGCTITDTFAPGVTSWYSGGSVVYLRNSNSAVDSSHGQGKLVLDTSQKSGYTSRRALDLNGTSQHSVKWVRDVDLVVNCPNSYPTALHLGATTLELMDNVNITQNCQEGDRFYALNTSDTATRQTHIETVRNCTVVTNGTIWRQDFPGAYVNQIENCTFSSTASSDTGFEIAGSMTFGEGNRIVTDAPMLFARADNAAGSLAFTAAGTYSAAEGGDAYDDEVIILQTPAPGTVAHNNNGTLEFVGGFTLTYMNHDGTELLWKDSYVTGETPMDRRSLTYEIDHVIGYSFDGWGTGIGTGVIDVTGLSADTTLYAQRSEIVLETSVIRTIGDGEPEHFALWDDAIDLSSDFWGKTVTLQLVQDVTTGSVVRGGYFKLTYDLNGCTLNYVGTDVFYKDTYPTVDSSLTVTSSAASKGVLHIENNTGLYVMGTSNNTDNPLTIRNVRIEAENLVSDGSATSAYAGPNGLISIFNSGTGDSAVNDVYVTDSELFAPGAPVIDFYTNSSNANTRINATLQNSSLEGGEFAVNIHGGNSANPVLTLTADKYCTFKNAEGSMPVKTSDNDLTLQTVYPGELLPIEDGWHGFQYRVQFVNENGTVLQDTYVLIGETPVYEGVEPVKEADEQYTYTFNGWTPEITEVTDTAVYKATYSADLITYTIRFLNEDGSELQVSEVAVGQMPEYTGDTPVKDPTDNEIFTFAGWDSEIVPADGPATYTATYISERLYPFTYFGKDGEILGTASILDNTLELVQVYLKPYLAYKFMGWKIQILNQDEAIICEGEQDAIVDFVPLEALADDVWSKVHADENVTSVRLYARYEQRSDEYHYDVYYDVAGTRSERIQRYTEKVGTPLCLRAPATYTDDTGTYNFSHWLIDGNMYPSVSIDVWPMDAQDYEAEACYVVGEPSAEPTVVLNELYTEKVDRNHYIGATMTYSLPSGYTLVETGFRYASVANKANMESAYYSVYGKSGPSGTYTLHFLPLSDTSAYYVAAYLKYKDIDGTEHTIYSNNETGVARGYRYQDTAFVRVCWNVLY